MFQWGFNNRVFADADKSRFRRILNHAKSEAAESQAQLAELARAARRAATGQPNIALARAYQSSGQYDDAVATLKEALRKGELSDADQARVELGIAYLKNRQPEQARATFAAVDACSQWHDLAELWSLRASNIEPDESG